MSAYDRATYEVRRSAGFYARLCPTCGQAKQMARYCPDCPRPTMPGGSGERRSTSPRLSLCLGGKRWPNGPCALLTAEWPLPHRHCQVCDAPCATSQRCCGGCMAAIVVATDGHCQLCSDSTDTLLCPICNLGITRSIQRAMGASVHEMAYTPRLEDEQHSVDHLRTTYSTLDGRGGDQRLSVVPVASREVA